MENFNFFSFFNVSPDNPDLPENRRSLYRTLHAALSYLPTLSVFITVGFGIVYLLGYAGLLDKNEPRLLIVGGIAFLAALLHIPLFNLMKQGKLDAVAIFLVMINSTAAMMQVLLWQGIVWFPIMVTAIPFLIFITQSGIRGRVRILAVIIAVLCLATIYFADRAITFKRMEIEQSLTQMAALSIYLIIVAAMAVLTLLSSEIDFRTIAGRLATTFTFIALLSSIATLIIAALANLYFDRQKIFIELEASSKVRADQVGVAIDNLVKDVNRSFSDNVINQFAVAVFTMPYQSGAYQDAFERVRDYIVRQQVQNSRYQEILLIGPDGKAIFSTMSANIGKNFSSFNFYQNTNIGIYYSVESRFPGSFDQASIILVRPFFNTGRLQGAYAVRVNFDLIKQILIANTGIGSTAETYLVGLSNGSMVPLSNLRASVEKVNTYPAEQSLMFNKNRETKIWDNYIGVSVLGSYVRIPSLRAVLISEIEQSEVTQKTINISEINAIIGIFTLLLAFTIVIITSRSIALPIVEMADKASSLASGQLSTRIQTVRKDEIGVLSNSFNSMASELQNLIQTLEDKVEDRTKELRKQTNYLRIAAEVARDATTSQSLQELLNRSAQLILDRFDFYHTGIFLLDENKDYAILRASPTKAGQEMLARQHKLKVGQVGIVGNVAGTGLSRIALDTGKDTSYFNNPLLPNTRSEMALPLKVNNELIGVLDVQSDQREAFTQDDIGILQIMADQLALAIQRVQLAQDQQENLRQLENAYQQFTFTSWNKLSQKSNFQPGYSFDGMNLVPLSSIPADAREILSKGQSTVYSSYEGKDIHTSTLAVPVKLREQVIGVMTILFNSPYISKDSISLAEDTAALLATALENARLYTETQKSAERERTVSQITSKIRSTNDPNEMIRIAMSELKQTLQVNDARVVPLVDPKKNTGK